MNENAGVEVQNVSYFDKLRESFCGMGVGCFMFFTCLALAVWNEYRNVANIETINEARESYVEAPCSPIDPALDGKLVHVTCNVGNLNALGASDPMLLGIPQAQRTGLSLKATMEVYRWVEKSTSKTSQKPGGGETRTIIWGYDRIWSTSTPVSNTSFNNQGATCQSENNGLLCYQWDPHLIEPWWPASGYQLGTMLIDKAQQPMVGDFVLPEDATTTLGDPVALTPDCGTATTTNNSATRLLQTNSTSTTTAATRTLSCAPGNSNPTLDDGNKVTWHELDSDGNMIPYMTRVYTLFTVDTVSVLAEQSGNTFVPWQGAYDEDYTVYEFLDGNYTALEMLDHRSAANVGITWMLRFSTLFLMIFGVVLMTGPLTVMPDVIPCIGPMVGDLVGYVLWIFACVCGCCCWSIVVAAAWVAYRPVVGISMFCVAAVLAAVGGGVAYFNKKRKERSGEGVDNIDGAAGSRGLDGPVEKGVAVINEEGVAESGQTGTDAEAVEAQLEKERDL